MKLERKVPKFDESRIIALVQSGNHSIKDIAIGYKTTPRTISRIMSKAGPSKTLPRMTAEQARMIKLLEEHNMTPDKLAHWLQMPAFTPENIQNFLNECTKEELSQFFYVSALVKLSEIALLVQQQNAKPTEPQ